MCTKIYIKMPCKKLQIPPGPSVDHMYTGNFHLAHISDWNLNSLLWLQEERIHVKMWIHSFVFSLLISETSEFVELPWYTQASEAIRGTNLLEASDLI
jgi:hypothetical protein